MELKPTGDEALIEQGIPLIVPYGIETLVFDTINRRKGAFNCTLWN